VTQSPRVQRHFVIPVSIRVSAQYRLWRELQANLRMFLADYILKEMGRRGGCQTARVLNCVCQFSVAPMRDLELHLQLKLQDSA